MSIQSETPNNGPFAVELYYNNQRLLPAPLIDWTVESNFNDVGVRISNNNRLTLTGSVLIVPSGSYERMYTKQQELRNLFAVDGKDLVILAGDGNRTLTRGAIISSGLKPKITSINISPDTHVTRFDYTIEMEDLVAASGVSGITSSLSNQWSFKEDSDSCTMQVTHSVSAEGPDGEADKFQQALAAVKPLLGIDKLPLDLPYFAQPNFSGMFGMTHPANSAGGPVFEVSVQREENADVANGTYSVTEIFTIVSGVPFFFTAKTYSFDEDQNGIATVTVAGTVQGLGRTLVAGLADGGYGFERASSGFINKVKPTLPWEASGVYLKYKGSPGSGLSLFNPTSYSVAENRCKGTIGFSVTYTDDINAQLPSGISSLSCSTAIVEGIRVFASHAIPFRRLGNVLQDIRTSTEGTITIQCQAQAKNTGNPTIDTNRAIAAVQFELNRLKNKHGNPNNYVTIRVGGLDQQLDDKNLTCSSTLNLTFTQDLVNAPSANADISLRTL